MSDSVIVAIGSNLGDRYGFLQLAVQTLAARAGVAVTGVSPVVHSAAVGGPAGQPDFLNAVVSVQCSLTPQELLAVCQEAEQAAQRVRQERWGPRTLDVDIVHWPGVRSDDETLTLPHPRAHLRAFVLAPWALLVPGAQFVPYGHTQLWRVSDLALAAPDADAVAVADRVLVCPQ